MSGDNSWRKISSSLESNNKIYGYRVDAAHNFTFRMLDTINRKDH
jgi:condensin complex subunit 2